MKFIKHIVLIFIFFGSCSVPAQQKFETKPNSEDLKNDVFIITELNKTDVVMSDSIVVKYKLYVSHNTGINGWDEVEELIYQDFKAKKTELGQMNIGYEQYDGKQYRTVLLKEVTLKPNKIGKLKLPKYVLNLTVEVPSNPPKELYDRPQLEKRDITITTNEIHLTVK